MRIIYVGAGCTLQVGVNTGDLLNRHGCVAKEWRFTKLHGKYGGDLLDFHRRPEGDSGDLLDCWGKQEKQQNLH